MNLTRSISVTPAPLPRSLFAQETSMVAQQLLGKLLVSDIEGEKTAGVIVETEAYLPRRDSACHASKHRTNRTEVMFGPAGFAYVYPIHAKVCFNVVTESEESGCAVLIRAVEPVVGIELMRHRRGLENERRLTSGPSCLCQALGIDRTIDRLDLTLGKSVWIEEGLGLVEAGLTIKSSKRIGVTTAKTRLLRYYVSGNRFVSGSAKMRS